MTQLVIKGVIYLFENIKFGQAKYNWLIVDTQGKEINSKPNNIPFFRSRASELVDVMFKYNDNFCYWNSFNDTIFDVFPLEYHSRYQFAQNSFRVTPNNIGDMKLYSSKIFIPRGFWESKKYLFFKYHMESKSGFGLVDKSDEKIYSLEQGENQKNNKGYINDIDAGSNFIPLAHITIDDTDYLVGSIDAVELVQYFKGSFFKNSTPKFPEKKKQLEQLANSLDENDNPVLMLVKLKK